MKKLTRDEKKRKSPGIEKLSEPRVTRKWQIAIDRLKTNNCKK